MLGRALCGLDDDTGAAQAYSEAVELEPTNSSYRQELNRANAAILGRAGRWAELETLARQLAADEPGNAWWQALLGKSLYGQGNFSGAAQAYSVAEAVRAEPTQSYYRDQRNGSLLYPCELVLAHGFSGPPLKRMVVPFQRLRPGKGNERVQALLMTAVRAAAAAAAQSNARAVPDAAEADAAEGEASEDDAAAEDGAAEADAPQMNVADADIGKDSLAESLGAFLDSEGDAALRDAAVEGDAAQMSANEAGTAAGQASEASSQGRSLKGAPAEAMAVEAVAAELDEACAQAAEGPGKLPCHGDATSQAADSTASTFAAGEARSAPCEAGGKNIPITEEPVPWWHSCVHVLESSVFGALIETNGEHDGCGFIGETLLEHLLGGGLPARRCCALQVRILKKSAKQLIRMHLKSSL